MGGRKRRVGSENCRAGGRLKQMEVKQTKPVKQTEAPEQIEVPERTRRRGLRGRSQLRFLPCLAVAVMLLAAGCGGSGAPTGFDSEDGGDTVRENFIEGCEVSVKDDTRLADDANRICVCTYDKIFVNRDTSEGITFEQFDGVDDDLREDITKLSEPTNDSVISKIREYIRDCITENS